MTASDANDFAHGSLPAAAESESCGRQHGNRQLTIVAGLTSGKYPQASIENTSSRALQSLARHSAARLDRNLAGRRAYSETPYACGVAAPAANHPRCSRRGRAFPIRRGLPLPAAATGGSVERPRSAPAFSHIHIHTSAATVSTSTATLASAKTTKPLSIPLSPALEHADSVAKGRWEMSQNRWE